MLKVIFLQPIEDNILNFLAFIADVEKSAVSLIFISLWGNLFSRNAFA